VVIVKPSNFGYIPSLKKNGAMGTDRAASFSPPTEASQPTVI
jgi:hypothetical protein